MILTSIGQLAPASGPTFVPVNCHWRPTTWPAFAADHFVKSASGVVITVGSAVGTATCFLTGKL